MPLIRLKMTRCLIVVNVLMPINASGKKIQLGLKSNIMSPKYTPTLKILFATPARALMYMRFDSNKIKRSRLMEIDVTAPHKGNAETISKKKSPGKSVMVLDNRLMITIRFRRTAHVNSSIEYTSQCMIGHADRKLVNKGSSHPWKAGSSSGITKSKLTFRTSATGNNKMLRRN